MSGKEIEVSVLTKGALLLQQCQNSWDDENRDTRLADAVKYNQTIWSIFQSELSKPDNPLPKKLRQDILSLSLFIDKRLFEIMTSPAPEKLHAVININLNLAAGLRSNAAL
jgi:flagellar protein FlaF